MLASYRACVLGLLLLAASVPAAALTVGGFDGARGGSNNAFGAGAVRERITACFPEASFVGTQTLTPAYLAGIDLLLIDAVRDPSAPITPLNASEQGALSAFVEGGRGAYLVSENSSFSTASNSFLSPFGIAASSAFGGGIVFAPITDHASFPLVTDGPFGTVGSYRGGAVGGFSAVGLATVLGTWSGSAANGQPAVLARSAIGAGGGRIVVVGDHEIANTPDNVALLLNTVLFLVPSLSAPECAGRPDGAPCGDVDGNSCTVAACEACQCNQTFTTAAETTPCELDGDQCTIDACDGGGTCVNAGSVACQPAVPPCEAGESCDPGTGACVTNTDAAPGTPCADDANPCTDDACDGLGLCQHPTNTAACEDGNACTTNDQCADGTCVAGPAAVCLACEQCDELVGCVATPRSDCKMPTAPKKAQLKLKNAAVDATDQLVWKWGRGEATTFAELGTPTSTDGYALCVFDASAGLVARLTAPAGGTCSGKPCWKQLGSTVSPKGYRYRDRDGLPDDVDGILLKSGSAGRAKVSLKAKGDHVPMPELNALTFPLQVQLQSQGGTCFGSTFTGTTARSSTLLKATSD